MKIIALGAGVNGTTAAHCLALRGPHPDPWPRHAESTATA